jgi:uncharacterized damage-inducible protein DinB
VPWLGCHAPDAARAKGGVSEGDLMTASLLEAAFAHHVWATSRLIDACIDLTVAELQTSVPGTRGPMLETVRHIVSSDTFDLFVLTRDSAFDSAEDTLTLAQARVAIARNGVGWAEYIARSLDPDELVHEIDTTDGYQRWAPVGFRLAGVLNHGSDHRSQVCTALSALGLKPPRIDVFDFGVEAGRIVEKMSEA